MLVRFFFLLFLFLVSVVSLVVYTTVKRKNRKLASRLFQENPATRTISGPELEACRALYGKFARNLTAGSAVYKINGPHQSMSLKQARQRVVTHHYLGPVAFLPFPTLEHYLETENSAEVVLLPDGTALILSLNEGYTIAEESRRQQCLAGKLPGSITGRDFTLAPLNRPLTAAEIEYRYPLIKIDAALCILTAGVLPLFLYSPPLLFASAGFAFAGLFLLFKKRTAQLPSGCRPFSLTGALRIKDDPAGRSQYSIGGFSLLLPEHWRGNLETGRSVSVQGYATVAAYQPFTVLALDGQLSVQTDPRLNSGRKFIPFALSAVLMLGALIAHGLVYNPVQDTLRYCGYLQNRGKQQVFGSVAELREIGVSPGQEITLKGFRLLPDYSLEETYGQLQGFLLINQETDVPLDLSSIASEVAALIELQSTQTALHLFLLQNYPEDNYRQGISVLLKHADSRPLSAFMDRYQHSAFFPETAAAGDLFIKDEYPFYDSSYDLSVNYENFLRSETDRINRKLFETGNHAAEQIESLALSFVDVLEYPENIDSLALFGLWPDSTNPFQGPNNAAEFSVREQPLAHQILKDFAAFYSAHSPGRTPLVLRGIVKNKPEREAGGYHLQLALNESYQFNDYAHITTISFLLLLGVFLLIAGMALYEALSQLRKEHSLLK